LGTLQSENVKKPIEVFQFMEAKQIGLLDYLFYNAYGRLLEEQKEFERAEKLYQSGIERKAQPEDKMRDVQTAFEARMYKRMKTQQEQEQSGLLEEAGPTTDRENARIPLGTLKTSASVRSYDPNARGMA